jgi:hypothetical protein
VCPLARQATAATIKCTKMTDGTRDIDTSSDDGAFVVWSRLLITGLFLTISTLTLQLYGWQYDDTGGGPLEKFHPATTLTMLVFAYCLMRAGNPFDRFLSVLASHTEILPYLFGIVFMIVYSTRVIGLPFTIFIETFLAPLVLFLLFDGLDDREGKRLARLIHVLLLINAVLGIYEFAAGFRLTPLVVNGEVLTDELRSTALLGHPLANAAVVGCYVLMLALGGGRDLPPAAKFICFTVNMASMIVFGGRAATVFVLVGLALIMARRTVGLFSGRKFDLGTLKAAVAIVPAMAAGIVVLAESGFFDNFINRLSDDDGSASTRIAMFELFNHIDWRSLILVPDAKQVATWSTIYGLDYGLENFIVAFIFSYGILSTVIFLPSLLLFCWAVTRSIRKGGVWVFVYFFAVALTSLSLSAKGPLFSTLIVLLMILMRRDGSVTPAPQQARHYGARNPRSVAATTS